MLPCMPEPIFLPLRGTSLNDGVAARLRAIVFDGEVLPGAYIDEKALATAWQVSRTPLRETLKVLKAWSNSRRTAAAASSS